MNWISFNEVKAFSLAIQNRFIIHTEQLPILWAYEFVCNLEEKAFPPPIQIQSKRGR